MAPSLPQTFRAAVLDGKGTKLVLKDIDLKLPGPGQVLIKTLACGICHTDEFLRQGVLGNCFPRIPGHEVIGDIVAVGEGVTRVKDGERVGGPWHGGHDGTCRSCQRGIFQTCGNEEINGVTMDGGYAEYVLLRAEAAVRIPPNVDPAEAAPLLCAGVTTFNAMRRMGVIQGDLVAVQGLGGLGHLAVQFASKMGYEVVAISSGGDKRDFATQLGAHHYIDTSKEDPVKALTKLGGAAMICSTAPHAKAVSPLVGGLAPQGKLIMLAPLGPVEFDTTIMVTKAASVHGWPSGHALDCEETISFAGTHGVKCLIEKFPLDRVQEAFEHMTSGKVRFRAVLTM
ncbi:putative alcohol dehydrogenase [Diaporthe ampelina]|uniref:Putative alcohol dehydrogenase n=1 Tax=Diaporthe ampelina TaxID=1214573 RepID=A0A0G2HDM2_9PEZI|nr:putative alcohol dehydrogenase [Diaporthe ampelina]